ncbi:MAG: Gldg family protein [Prolixibacteraceae bacterium]|jgi:gliding-associated putative ABC transporter substrate-binding component GldG|nr:Gldg family protein [Prolixibacteraceae bacterium]
MKKNSLITYAILSAGILVLLNILSSRYFLRADFTADKRYTLSGATKDIVRSLEDPVTVTAYFTKDLPPQISQTKNEFKELLVEYANLSKGNLVYEFVSPNDDQELEQELAQKGIQPRLVSVREKDQAIQKSVYLSAVVQYNEKEEIIPWVFQGASMEYDLSTAIKKLTVENKPMIGFVQGHREPGVANFMQAAQSLNVLYDIEDVTMADTINLSKYETMVITAPADSFSQADFSYLDKYMNNGGNLYIAIDRVNGDLQNAMGSVVSTGLESWLQNKGIDVESTFIVDNSAGNISVVQQQGFMRIQTQMKFPYIPYISNFGDHPVVKGLETVVMQFVSPITFNGDSAITATPIAFTSEMSGTEVAPLRFNIQKKWNKSDYNKPTQAVAFALEGKLSEGNTNRMVVIGDGNFAVNGAGQQAQQINADNVNLMVNAIDWLTDDTGLIELRTKGVTNRPLDQLEDGRKTFLKYLNFLLPILLIIFYGIVRSQRNRALRYKRMQENFV